MAVRLKTRLGLKGDLRESLMWLKVFDRWKREIISVLKFFSGIIDRIVRIII